ncbi:MAG TPA: MFS transporter [Actinocrinis sp.]|nr:MFS transporter [Actinocrinis sp.]
MEVIGPRRWWAVAALALALLVGGLDLTVLNLALPTLAVSLHASTAGLQWIVDSYSLVMAAMLLPGGLLGDRFGRKRFMLLALVLFGGASLWCAYCTSSGELIAARALLGLGAALVFPLALGVVPVMFSEAERPRAVTVLMGSTIIAYPIGPLLGGWLLTHYWWGSVFLINVPLTLIAVVAVAFLVPESRSTHRPWLDIGGVAISSLGLAGMTFGVIEAGEHGWGSASALATLSAGVFILAVFAFWELRVSRWWPNAQPLVDLGLFRSAGFSWGTGLSTLVSFAMFGLLFTVPQFFQDVRGTDAMSAGVQLLPMIFGLVLGAAAADRLVAAAGPAVTVAVGFTLMAAGLGVGTATHADSGAWFTATWIGLIGIGLGFALPTSVDAALGRLSKERAGVGSAVIQAVRQVGATFGVALLGSVLSSAYRGRLDLHALSPSAADTVQRGVSGGVAVAQRLHSASLLQEVRGAFVHGMQLMLWVCGGLAVVGVVLALVFLPGRAAPAGAAAGSAGEDEKADETAATPPEQRSRRV